MHYVAGLSGPRIDTLCCGRGLPHDKLTAFWFSMLAHAHSKGCQPVPCGQIGCRGPPMLSDDMRRNLNDGVADL